MVGFDERPREVQVGERGLWGALNAVKHGDHGRKMPAISSLKSKMEKFVRWEFHGDCH